MKKSIGPRTIIQPNPVLIIGSYDQNGQANMMTVAWGGICCSKPPCAAISLRQATYTYGNIQHHKAFTINIPSTALVKEADYVGIYSGKQENKFESLGLTPVKSDVVNAPYVKLIFDSRFLKIQQFQGTTGTNNVFGTTVSY